MRQILGFCSMVYAVLALAPAPAGASPQATEWVRYTHSEVRMVRGIVRADGAVEMGVQVKLSPGWKTYWRVPGDSGVPPDFNWSRSANVRDIDVLWPTPSRFRDQFGDNIGYKDEVLFPLVVMPGDGTKPLTVKMNLNYAVCADVCVPVQADLSLDIPMQSVWPRYAAEIARYMRLVPKPPEEVSGLKVAAVTVDRTGKRPELIVDVTCEDPARPMDLFVEGDQSLFFGVPAETASDVGGRKRFRIPVDSSAGDAALKSGELRFVVVDGDKRLAQTWLLQ